MNCSIPGCSNKIKSRGFCSRHYERFRTGKPLISEKEPRKRGEGHTNTLGYVYIGKELEHRLIAARMAGRPLHDYEEVHHIDENPGNNNPDNLFVCTRQEHKRIHRELKAFKACGDRTWLRCQLCLDYDSPNSPDMWISKCGTFGQHRSCGAAKQKERRRLLCK